MEEPHFKSPASGNPTVPQVKQAEQSTGLAELGTPPAVFPGALFYVQFCSVFLSLIWMQEESASSAHLPMTLNREELLTACKDERPCRGIQIHQSTREQADKRAGRCVLGGEAKGTWVVQSGWKDTERWPRCSLPPQEQGSREMGAVSAPRNSQQDT